jgi:hypothetical protein
MDYKFIPSDKRKSEMKNPLRYNFCVSEAKKAKVKWRFKSKNRKEKYREEIYRFTEENYRQWSIALWEESWIWDTERATIDTIVIHHTKWAPWLTLDRLSAMELLRLYVAAYAMPADQDNNIVSGKPISSWHIRNGKQVFRPYHYLIREDGLVEQLLMDDETWWHCWVRKINNKSIGVCLDDDLTNKSPSDKQMTAIITLINTYRDKYKIPLENIVWHCEVKENRECPWSHFLWEWGWKQKIIDWLRGG